MPRHVNSRHLDFVSGQALRQRGVRLIAINDNVDTAKGDNDMTPFLNIMYEFYARDTSGGNGESHSAGRSPPA